jgi:type IV secretion system protein VirB10
MSDAPSPSDRPGLQVASAPRPWVMPLGVGAVVAAGAAVLVLMSQARMEREQPPAPAPAAFEPPPPPLEPLTPASAAAEPDPYIPAPHLMPQPPAVAGAPAPMLRTAAPAPERGTDPRLRAPAVVVELGAAPATLAAGGAAAPTPAASLAMGKTAETDEAFAERVSAASAPFAASRQLADPARTAVQGTVLPAVLETAINSDVPGFVRAVVSRDVRAFDGVTVVVPRGSRLIGQYRNAVAAGQSRAFVVWTRCIRPDGVAIDLGSPATDPLGQAGLAGETDRHFFRRFGAAIALSVLSSGLSAAGERGDRVIIGSSQDASRVAEIALQKHIDIPPTIRIPQGAPLSVFLARDLVFRR